MTRIIVYLAAATVLLGFTGCGDLPSGGAAVAANSAPPKPAPPAPDDKDLKLPAPPPLTPSKLPTIEAPPTYPAGEQLSTESTTTGPSDTKVSPGAIGEPANDPSTRPAPVTPPATPPASLDDLAQSLLGGSSPATTPNDQNGAPPDGSVQLTLSGGTISPISKEMIHVEISYAFTRGQATASNWYTVSVLERPTNNTHTPPGEMKVEGRTLLPQGEFKGDVHRSGENPVFDISVYEGASRQDEGHRISNRVAVTMRGGVGNGHRSSNARPAVPGVGAQGKGYGAGPIATPVAALFAAKEQIVFSIQIPHFMQLFNAENNRNPNSQEEFMKKIIEANGVKLPELPPGEPIYL